MLLKLMVLLSSIATGKFGAATGGSTTTLIDTAERDEANSFWVGMQLVMTTGSNAGLSRLITGHVSSTKTLTVTAFPNAIVSGDRYSIIASSSDSSDITSILADLGDGTDAATANAAAGSLHSKLTKLTEYLTSEPKVFPDTAVGVTVTAHADATFVRGSYAQIVAASGITTKFRPNAIIIQNVSAPDDYEIDIATGTAASEVDQGTFKFSTNDGIIPISSIAEFPANVRVAARIGCLDAVARTAEISLGYIDGLT